MNVVAIWFVVVFCAKSDETLICDESYLLLPRVSSQLCDHHVNPQVKLLIIDQKWIVEVSLSDVILIEDEGRNVFEPLNNHNAAALRTTRGFKNESLLSFSFRHDLF